MSGLLLYKGSSKINRIYKGSTFVKEIYKGSTRIWSCFSTLTINPLPGDSTVTLSASGYTQVGNTITVPYGTVVTWSVSRALYVTQTGTYTVTSDTTINVTLVQNLYPSGTVLFESATPGTYNIYLEHAQTYSIIMVGGGAGGSGIQTGSSTFRRWSYGGGGSGALIYGNLALGEGGYSVVVGSGGAAGYKSSGTNGTQSSFLNNVAGGGVSHYSNPTGGVATVVTAGLNGANGNSGVSGEGSTSGSGGSGGASLYGGYGAGGWGSWTGSQPGTVGYVKIWVP